MFGSRTHKSIEFFDLKGAEKNGAALNLYGISLDLIYSPGNSPMPSRGSCVPRASAAGCVRTNSEDEDVTKR